MNRKITQRAALVSGVLALSLLPTQPAEAGAEPFLGEIMWGGWNFCPRGFAEANGQVLSISQNTALFALLGTTYGGNGQTTFALPDLRGRAMVHAGAGAGLSAISLGQQGGTESQSLTFAQMPAHSHTATTTVTDLQVTSTLRGSSATATTSAPAGAALAVTKKSSHVYAAASPDQAMASGSVQSTVTGGTATTTIDATNSGSSPVPVRDPYTALLACIAVEGIFPSRP